MRSETTAPVDDAPGGLDRLCAHFSDEHELEVAKDAVAANVIFPGGVCAMTASAGGLHLRLIVDDAGALPPAEAFFTRHLQRLIFKARKPVEWSRSDADGMDQDNFVAAKLRSLAAALDRTVTPAPGE
jgi:hypothetical protein